MADNVLLPTGQTAATDDVGGIQFPRYKLTVGADGTAVDVQPPSDGQATTTALPSARLQHNGTALEMARGNTEGTLLASASRTATTTTATQTNWNARGVLLYLSVTVVPGSAPSLLVQLVGIDPVSGSGQQIAPNPSAITAVGLYGFMFYPGVGTNSAISLSQSVAVPRRWSVSVSHGNANAVTYSLSYALIV